VASAAVHGQRPAQVIRFFKVDSHRFYNPMIEAPFSEDLNSSSDYLDEFYGKDPFFDFQEEVEKFHE